MHEKRSIFQCKTRAEVDVPSERGMTRSLPMTLPDSSRKRSGRNCCGCCQSPGSMWALFRLMNTCSSNRAYTNHNIITIIRLGYSYVRRAGPQGQHLSTKLKTPKTQTRKMAATDKWELHYETVGSP